MQIEAKIGVILELGPGTRFWLQITIVLSDALSETSEFGLSVVAVSRCSVVVCAYPVGHLGQLHRATDLERTVVHVSLFQSTNIQQVL